MSIWEMKKGFYYFCTIYASDNMVTVFGRACFCGCKLLKLDQAIIQYTTVKVTVIEQILLYFLHHYHCLQRL